MSDFLQEITPVNIEDELKNSYLDYAMSVIVGRALPDVRDGLKPVHRRALYAMSELGNDWNKPYKKSARIVGDVIGKYHPHGDTAVYDTIVRMAQPFSLRYMLVDGQGNFGSVDGDSPAAMRYTEIRMSKIAHEILADLEKETVDFVPNYDGSEMMPDVLPTKIPNLLINGSSGIAVGMATNIPPHNLGEVISGCLAYIDNNEITTDELMTYIQGPDFPTAALINGRKGIIDAYRTGRGKVIMRAKVDIETDTKGRETIVVTEIPYQVNKARLIEKIAELVKEKKVEGISALRDESDKDGMRIVIECKREAVAEVVINNLYAQTQLQNSFGINMVALINGQPKLFTLKEMLRCFVDHRREVVTRRTIFELRKARERTHLLEGLSIALANLDEVIELIRAAQTPAIAKEQLLARGWQLGQVADMLKASGVHAARPEWLEANYGARESEGVIEYFLTEQQAQAILDLRLHRLTGLEHEKIIDEYKSLLETITGLLYIISDTNRLMEVIREELEIINANFNDPRRSVILNNYSDIDDEDLLERKDVVVTLSHEGYVKYQPLTDYDAQRRGGKGKSATRVKEEDYVERLLVANTHDTILCFSDRGRLYWLKVYQLPEASRGSRGRPIINLLSLDDNERITAILPITDYDENKFVFMATASGTVKKTPLTSFKRPSSRGIIALNLRDDDMLIGVDITTGNDDVMLFSRLGKVVRFNEQKVRSLSRTATGIRGMKLIHENDQVVSLIVVKEEKDLPGLGLDAVAIPEMASGKVCSIFKRSRDILTVTENGFGKRTSLDEYPTKGRAGQGSISIKVSERNGLVIASLLVQDADHFMMITNAGTLVRTRVSEVNLIGRNTHGVRLIRTSENEQVVGVQGIDESEIEETDLNSELKISQEEATAEMTAIDEQLDDSFDDDNEDEVSDDDLDEALDIDDEE